MIKSDWVKSGAIVIDVGINRIETEGAASWSEMLRRGPPIEPLG